MDIFLQLFRKLDPLAARQRTVRKPIALKEAIKNTLSIFEHEMKAHNVSAEIKGPDDFKFSAWSQDIYVIFTNLIDNSLYWINRKEGSTRKSPSNS